MNAVLEWATYLSLGYFTLLNGSYLVMGFFAVYALRSHGQRLAAYLPEDTLSSETLPPVTVIAPAYNEAVTCVESTRALLSLHYPQYEVLVVNDGSTDETLSRLKEAFALEKTARTPTGELPTEPVRTVYRSMVHPNLWVVDKENGGKSDALNTGINYCRTPLFCAIDADTLIESEALLRLVRPFLEDNLTVAVGGLVRIVNGCEVKAGRVEKIKLPSNLLPKLQVIEYLRAFLFGRVGWDGAGALLIISGAFGLFRRETVVAAGGYATDTVGEDMELVARLHRFLHENKQPYSIRFLPDPAAWTECPGTLSALSGQRDRWQRGLAETIFRHVRMLFNPQYGRVGMLAYPYYYFLETLGPAVEFVGYMTFFVTLALGILPTTVGLAFFMMAFAFGLFLSLAAVALEEFWFRRYEKTTDLIQFFVLPILETFGFRQLIAWYRMRGLWSYFQNVESWGAMERTGFDTSSS